MPRTSEEWFNKGLSLSKLGKHEDAITCYDKAIEIDPTNTGTWFNKGSSLSELGKHEDAITCYDKVIEIDPTNTGTWFNKGLSLSKLGKHEDAITCYDKAIKIDPKNLEAWFNKGYRLFELGRNEDAITCFDKAIEIDPTNTATWLNKGSSLSELGKHEDAITCFDKAIEIDPDYSKAWFNKGYSLSELGRNEDAITCFDKAIEIDPTNTATWLNKGYSLSELGRNEDAITCYDKAIEIDPDYWKAWNNKGSSLSELGKHEDAITCYDKVIEIDPTDTGALYNKGYSLSKLGKHEDAITCYDKAIEIDPDYSKAWYAKGFSTGILRKFSDSPTPSKSVGEQKSSVSTLKEIGIKEFIIPNILSNQKLRIALVQLDFKLTKKFPWHLANKKLTKEKILNAISTAEQENVDIICFPELSFDKEFLDEFKKHKDIVIIGGTFYDKNYYNVCPVSIKDHIYFIRKIHPAPTFETEIISGKKMNIGNDISIFTTIDKKLSFGVLICLDYLREGHDVCNYNRNGKKGIDLIFNPCYNPNPHRIQQLATTFCENYHVDTLQTNVMEINNEYGGSCMIALENKDNLKRLRAEELKPDDDITYKLYEAKGEKMIIAELKLKGLEVPTSVNDSPRIKIMSEYECKDNKWLKRPS